MVSVRYLSICATAQINQINNKYIYIFINKKNDDKSKTVQDTDREKLDAKFAKKNLN